MIDKEQFVEWNNESNEDTCLDMEEKRFRLTDEEARKIIKAVSRCSTAAEIQYLPVTKRDKYLIALRKKSLSIRKISRLTGVGFNVVRKF